MRGAHIACVLFTGLICAPGCAARALAPVATPAPSLYLNRALPSDARICMPLETFRNEGDVCITVGDLRAMLRLRRDITETPTGVPTKVVA